MESVWIVKSDKGNIIRVLETFEEAYLIATKYLMENWCGDLETYLHLMVELAVNIAKEEKDFYEIPQAITIEKWAVGIL